MKSDLLKLDNQLCFALYVASKEVIKRYKSLLDPYGLTYTGYITMLALYEQDQVSIKELGHKLYLDSGTLTPLLKKLENQGYIIRQRSKEDERQVFIRLTKTGVLLKESLVKVPEALLCSINADPKDGKRLLDSLHELLHVLDETPKSSS
ncbi:MAG: MarR family transcriptional regulator [Paracholeplasma sp.]|uniref:HTH-type transcriptional regulator SarZ n=1 Tax=Acholeplasma brassicae TaxID=61635 RepID=U4KNV6_9MOLU|nr:MULTISPECIES: MarR family transcriptional regulator [Paracholeplasma]MDY3196440.1 MarR family transcriptional regulator [Paracholeplasma sp.]CCV66077.1 Transcriptional regulator, MarR family [Paracholeplasma brassicae]